MVSSCFLLALLVYILVIGKSLLVPLALALVFWYIITRVIHFYQHMPYLNWHMPNTLALVFAIISTSLVIYVVFLLFSHSFFGVIHDAPLYQRKLTAISHTLTNLLGVHDWIGKAIGYPRSATHQTNILQQALSQINLTHFFTTLASIVSSMASNLTLILVYLIFLLLEYHSFDAKLQAMSKTPEHFHQIKRLIDKIDMDISSYLKIKSAINALAGILTYILLLSFKIHHAEFWGMLIFLLHYIPFIGPLIAIGLILLASSIQVTHLVPFISLGILLIVIQVTVGNVLEPKWMGTRLNLSPLIILLSLGFWGFIWGIVGMFLCVPIMVMVTIILAKFPSTRSIAIILSASGKLHDES